MSPEPPDADAWQAWTPDEAARVLEGVGVPWCVVGGWALDLWHGRETRSHEDLEIAIPRPYFDAIRHHLADYRLFSVGNAKIAELPPGDAPSEEHHQNWVLDPAVGDWRMDIFLEPGDEATWVCRRDESIRLPRAEIVSRTPSGIPFLLPQAVFAFKAKATRPKDEADFALALPLLGPPARVWLRDALGKLHPGHRWIEAL